MRNISLTLACVACVCICIAQSPPPTPSSGKNSEAKQNPIQPKQSEAATNNPSSNPSPSSIDKPTTKIAPDKQERKSDNTANESAPKWWELANAIGTVVTAGATLVILLVAYWQWRTSQKATQAAINSATTAAQAVEIAERATGAAIRNADGAVESAQLAERALLASIGKHKSIYLIADIFSAEAVKWTKEEYRAPSDPFCDWHNASIKHLSSHVHYVKTIRADISDKIWPHWVEYHGGNGGTEITPESYWYEENGKRVCRPKDYWIVCLYRIADILRES